MHVETEAPDAIAPVLKSTERIPLVDDEKPIVRMEKQMLERVVGIYSLNRAYKGVKK